MPVYAVQRGEVSFASKTSNGFAVSLTHKGGYLTHYAHLDQMFVRQNLTRTRRLEFVEASQVIGYAAKTPVHVRFEVWERTYTQGFVPADPLAYLKDWIISSADTAITPNQQAA